MSIVQNTKIKKNLCLTITSSCNWDCKWCIAETNLSASPENRRKWDGNLMIKASNTLDRIPADKYNSITLTGGEPGLVPKDLLINLLRKSYSKGLTIDINTNGTIFKWFNDYVDAYVWQNPAMDANWIESIDTIDWHVAPDLTFDLDHFRLYNRTINQMMIQYTRANIKLRPLFIISTTEVNGDNGVNGIESFVTKWVNEIGNNVSLEFRPCLTTKSGDKTLSLTVYELLHTYRILKKMKSVFPLVISDETLFAWENAISNKKPDIYEDQ